MRKQYCLVPSESGYNAWDVDNLIELTKDFKVVKLSVDKLLENNNDHWYKDGDLPTSKSIFDHMKLVDECSLKYPIIVSAEGKIMDGMHRVGKAYLNGFSLIDAVVFEVTPDPDFL